MSELLIVTCPRFARMFGPRLAAFDAKVAKSKVAVPPMRAPPPFVAAVLPPTVTFVAVRVEACGCHMYSPAPKSAWLATMAVRVKVTSPMIEIAPPYEAAELPTTTESAKDALERFLL